MRNKNCTLQLILNFKIMKHLTKVTTLVFTICILSAFVISVKEPTPQGTIKLKDNFYFDKTEVTNVEYREYLHWLNNIYNQNSEEYKKALPDTSVWSGTNVFIDLYFRHPQYGNNPVIGLTLEQAKKYCKWRSDRVYENMMVNKKAIYINNKVQKDSIFTIENFLSGKYPSIRKLSPDEYYPIPEYKLPTKEEWEFAASSNLDINKYEYGVTDLKKKHFNTKEISENFSVEVKKSEQNDFKLLGMIGNVAEMVEEPNISKGGSWFNSLNDCKIKNDIPYTKPTAWLGFRCVCKWRYK